MIKLKHKYHPLRLTPAQVRDLKRVLNYLHNDEHGNYEELRLNLKKIPGDVDLRRDARNHIFRSIRRLDKAVRG